MMTCRWELFTPEAGVTCVGLVKNLTGPSRSSGGLAAPPASPSLHSHDSTWPLGI